jgi:hypothetical protein
VNGSNNPLRNAGALLLIAGAGGAAIWAYRHRQGNPGGGESWYQIAQDWNPLNTGWAKMGEPRCIRNNNPGNLRLNGIPWQGKSANQTDGTFIVFDSAHYGIRAMARTLGNYFTLHGLDTVAGIIGRWAPSVENNTSAYVQDVASNMGVQPDWQLADNADTMLSLVKAIITHENGQQPYSTDLIANAIASA